MSNATEYWSLEIVWHDAAKDLPTFVGPFDTEQEAADWAALNVTDATCVIRMMTYPYMRANGPA